MHLRPMAPYEFLPIPEKIDGVWHWQNTRIMYTPELGHHMQTLNPRKGLLMPYIGNVVTQQRYNTLLRNPTRKSSPDYLLDIDGNVFLDGNPADMTDEPGCCPTSYLNEPAVGTNALYNCQIVLLRRSDYSNIPDYPKLPNIDPVPFVEWMTDTPLS